MLIVVVEFDYIFRSIAQWAPLFTVDDSEWGGDGGWGASSDASPPCLVKAACDTVFPKGGWGAGYLVTVNPFILHRNRSPMVDSHGNGN